MHLLSPASAIIFDLDGTLFKTSALSEPAFRLIVEAIRSQKGIEMDYFSSEEVASFIGHTFNEVWEMAFARHLPGEKEYIHHTMQEAERKMLMAGAGALYAGIPELLQKTSEEGYRLYLASNCSEFYMQPVIEKTDIAHHFTATYPIGRYHYMSDKSELLSLIIAENPHETGFITVGDREMDITAAQENHLGSIGVLWGFGGEHELSSADLLAGSPQQLCTMLIKENLLVYDLANYILELRERKKKGALMVGISGIDNSGKTTICMSLSESLRRDDQQVSTIHIDDFHNPQKIRHQDPQHPCISFYQHGFDYSALEERILKPLREEGTLTTTWTGIDISTDERTLRRDYNIPPDGIALVEGVFIFRQALRDYFDLRIFVDISPETSLERVRTRHRLEGKREEMELKERYDNRYLPGQDIYLNDDKPKEHSQIIIDNNDHQHPFFTKHPLF
ncbi:Phosphoglycolate phosphatase [subsurface metagenome]